MTQPSDEDWIGSTKRGLRVHLVDPIDPTFTLCGLVLHDLARDDIKSRPELRCPNCASKFEETQQQ